MFNNLFTKFFAQRVDTVQPVQVNLHPLTQQDLPQEIQLPFNKPRNFMPSLPNPEVFKVELPFQAPNGKVTSLVKHPQPMPLDNQREALACLDYAINNLAQVIDHPTLSPELREELMIAREHIRNGKGPFQAHYDSREVIK